MTSRWFDLSGCDNSRDLGGLPTVDGRRTRFGVFLRADTVQELTDDDVATLVGSYGLRTVIDLRAQPEAAREGRGPLAAQPVAYHNLSFLTGEYIMPDDPRFPMIVADLKAEDQVNHYLDYLRLAGPVVGQAITVLAEPGAAPALFHCAGGKDRTGVLAALLCALVGVEREAIVDDFILTNERIARVDAKLARLPSYRRDRDKLSPDRTSCRPEVMRSFLDGLDQEWGGAAEFARANGVGDDALGRLTDLLVEP